MARKSALSFLWVLLQTNYYCIENIISKCVEAASKPKKSLNGRVILVTGAARGIGYEIVEELLKKGAGKVALCDILEVSIVPLQDNGPTSCIYHICNQAVL